MRREDSVSSAPHTKTVIMSDVRAGFAITKYDWCGMEAFLQSYAQYTDIHELNTERNLDFVTVGTRLGAILYKPMRGMTFHIFWSPRDRGGRLRSDLVDLRDVVKSIVEQGHVPYICLDMTAMEELELNDPEHRVCSSRCYPSRIRRKNRKTRYLLG